MTARQRAASRGRSGPLAQHVGQGSPFHQPHAEIRPAVLFAGVVDSDDVRMVEEGGGTGLGLEAGQVLRRGELAAQDHLEGDGALEAALPCAVDDSHAAAAEFL